MKRILLLPALLMMITGLMAQETTVSVMVKEDGKVVRDTTYVYDSAGEAEEAIKILDLVLESHGDQKHSKKMVFISEDGKKTHIDSDAHTWTMHEDHDGDHVKVMKVHVDENEHGEHGKRVIVVSSDDGESFDILLDEDSDHDVDGEKVIVKKEVKVIVKTDEDGEWEVIEKEVKEGDVDHDEDTEVIVIKKKQKKSKKQ